MSFHDIVYDTRRSLVVRILILFDNDWMISSLCLRAIKGLSPPLFVGVHVRQRRWVCLLSCAVLLISFYSYLDGAVLYLASDTSPYTFILSKSVSLSSFWLLWSSFGSFFSLRRTECFFVLCAFLWGASAFSFQKILTAIHKRGVYGWIGFVKKILTHISQNPHNKLL